jgi:hypothetical protein
MMMMNGHMLEGGKEDMMCGYLSLNLNNGCFSQQAYCRTQIRFAEVVAPDRASSALTGFVPETTAKIRLR